MAIHEIAAYQQTAESWKTAKSGPDQARSSSAAKSSGSSAAPETGRSSSAASKTELKPWNPISGGSSLIPRKTDYGMTIGDVKLSDKASDYYDKLKGKFGGMEFIVVSKDMKEQVKANAAMYGNAKKQVVLIDEEKLERMATDENYRNKYEGIIAMSQSRLAEMKNSLASTGAGVKNFGMSVDEKGNESFFATVEKSGRAQKERIERKAAEKKEAKKAEKKAEQKKAEKERLEKRLEERKAEKKEAEEKLLESVNENAAAVTRDGEGSEVMQEDNREYVTISSGSINSLINKVQNYSFGNAADRVMTGAEKMLGGHIDFKG
jgi:hypothetical protein